MKAPRPSRAPRWCGRRHGASGSLLGYASPGLPQPPRQRAARLGQRTEHFPPPPCVWLCEHTPSCSLVSSYACLSWSPWVSCFIAFEVSVNDSVSAGCPGDLDLLTTVLVDPHCLWFVSLSAWWSLTKDLCSFALTCGKTGDLCLHLLLPRAGAQLASCHCPQLSGETPLPVAPVLSSSARDCPSCSSRIVM